MLSISYELRAHGAASARAHAIYLKFKPRIPITVFILKKGYARNACDYSLYDTFYLFLVFFYVLLVIFELKYSFKCHASSGRTTSVQTTTYINLSFLQFKFGIFHNCLSLYFCLKGISAEKQFCSKS